MQHDHVLKAGVRCLTRAFCNVLWRFAMQRYVTIKRFVSLQNYFWAVSRKTFCETNRCISKALRSGLWAYSIHSSVYTLQCSRESSQRCSVRCNTLSDPPKTGVNVSDESALHRVHLLIPAKIQNKSPTCLFIKWVVKSPIKQCSLGYNMICMHKWSVLWRRFFWEPKTCFSWEIKY